MESDPHAVQIFVDGSCYPQQARRSGTGGIVMYPGDDSEQEIVFQGYQESTINRMELAACIRVLEWVREQALGRRGFSRVQIFSDLQYVVKYLTH